MSCISVKAASDGDPMMWLAWLGWLAFAGCFVILVITLRRYKARLADADTQRAELAYKERLLNLFVAYTPMALAIFDRDMNYLAVNRDWMRSMGTDENLVGKNHYELFPHMPEDRKEIHQKALNGSVQGSDAELFLGPDGERSWARWQTQPWYGDDGKVGGVVSFVEDVTAKINSERELRRAKEKYEKLVDNLPDRVMELDLEGRILYANFDLADLPKERMLGRSIFSVTPRHWRERLRDAMKQAIQGSATKEHTVDLEIADGKQWWRHRIVPMRKAREPARFLFIGSNVTEARQAQEDLLKAHADLELRVQERTEALTAANEELRAWTYLTSHDLRTPMVNIMGFLGELDLSMGDMERLLESLDSKISDAQRTELRRLLKEEASESMGFIKRATSQMDRLTSAVLKLSRQSQRPLALEELNLEEVMQAVLERMGPSLQEKDVKVWVGDMPRIVCDRVAIDQIMWNLLKNAVNFMDVDRPGTVDIWSQDEEHFTTFHMRDNGVGIRKEDQTLVFEPFRRSGNLNRPGEGIGLAFVKTLVNRHGGRIWCESELGAGSCFSFTISNHLEDSDGAE